MCFADGFLTVNIDHLVAREILNLTVSITNFFIFFAVCFFSNWPTQFKDSSFRPDTHLITETVSSAFFVKIYFYFFQFAKTELNAFIDFCFSSSYHNFSAIKAHTLQMFYVQQVSSYKVPSAQQT